MEIYKCVFSLSQSFPLFVLFIFFTESQFPDLLALPVYVVESMLKALKMNSEEARLKFPRLLQVIEMYPSETLDLMTKEVGIKIRDVVEGKPTLMQFLKLSEYKDIL